ncbi:MAG: 2-hydroxyglutaryl-CoA dehydratase, partial [Clostridia bacterium]|nr:2-hydroxyglutaryl-CoA dehydratase [Clostridia bacterium]
MRVYRAGIDVGSTTVKLVVLDDDGKVLYGEYRRHFAEIQPTLADMLVDAKDKLGLEGLRLKITGSGSINLGKALSIGFMQEVVAVATAVETLAPQTDVAIELGGEDAKIIYFKGGLEERMNGVCAGGTGSFIDQMAALLQTDATGLDKAAKEYKQIYPIAARCGVFAKTDIQPLINEGATKADLAASIFQAVVNQTISGLACGKPIRGKVAFLGGPLHFLPQLKAAFVRTLRLKEDEVIGFDYPHLLAATGSALCAGDETVKAVDDLIDALRSKIHMDFEIKRLSPLFADEEEFARFEERHAKAVVAKQDIATYTGNCYLGIDAGSTTTKLALIGDEGQLLFSYYTGNLGNPVQAAIGAMNALAKVMPEGARI